MADEAFLARSYDAFARVEEAFKEALDQGLHPRGPDLLYELAAGLEVEPGASVLDVGCGEGRHTLELAARHGWQLQGVDPVQRHIEIAREDLAERARTNPALNDAVAFDLGTAETIPASTGSVRLIWCRDMLVHIQDLAAAYDEFRRVLAPGGQMLVYQMFCTDRMEPREAEWLLPTMGCVEANMRPDYVEAVIRRAGLQIDQRIILGTEWGQYSEERSGKGSRNLLHAGRLLHEPDRYVQQFGRENYDIALGDCLWHIYRLIGKLSDRIYLLSAPEHQSAGSLQLQVVDAISLSDLADDRSVERVVELSLMVDLLCWELLSDQRRELGAELRILRAHPRNGLGQVLLGGSSSLGPQQHQLGRVLFAEPPLYQLSHLRAPLDGGLGRLAHHGTGDGDENRVHATPFPCAYLPRLALGKHGRGPRKSRARSRLDRERGQPPVGAADLPLSGVEQPKEGLRLATALQQSAG
jgi:ubiquinone/menaquinone biosynthesis C-methylase UbiE